MTTNISIYNAMLMACMLCAVTIIVMWRILNPPTTIRSSTLDQPSSSTTAIAIVVSGLQSRCLKPCVDSLARYVVRPHTQAGYRVDVFIVLQRSLSSSSDLKQVDRDTRVVSEKNYVNNVADEFYIRNTIEDPTVGGHVITYATELAPSVTQLKNWYSLDKSNPLVHRFRNPKEGASKWTRNIRMYHNISRGFQSAEQWADGSRQPYAVYIRTRSDNIFFNSHPIYPRMAAHGVLVLPCSTYNGVNDKFLVFTSRHAINAFAHVLQHKAGNINRIYRNSEAMWGHSLRRHGIQWTYLPRYRILMSHLGLRADGTTCYRWMDDACITTSSVKQQIKDHQCQS